MYIMTGRGLHRQPTHDMLPWQRVTNKAEIPVQATEVCPGPAIRGASGPVSRGRPP